VADPVGRITRLARRLRAGQEKHTRAIHTVTDPPRPRLPAGNHEPR
jgi:hypothetical protein